MKTWFDISGIYEWQGNFTGIQRVVYNLGRELSTSVEIGFFVFRHGIFQEVSFTELEERLKRRQSMAGSYGARQQKRTFAAAQHYGMVGLKKVVRGSPYEASLRRVYAGMRKTYRMLRHIETHRVMVPDLFGTNDVVIIADGNWQFVGYAQALAAAKKRISFKLIHFVHDLVAVKNPALANPGADKIIGDYLHAIFDIADRLVVVSESTKRDVAWFADSHSLKRTPPVNVLTLGDDVSTGKKVMKEPDVRLPRQFMLAVGTIEIRKNYGVLYFVLKRARQEEIPLPHLVIVGRKGWMAEEAYALLTKDTEIANTVTILQGASDLELEWLYEHCLFTLFPSFYEGWGLPVAESLVRGKCCISSDVSSMPEVGKDLAEYVSPYDPAQIIETISRLSQDKDREMREQVIREGYVPHTWKQSFDELLIIVREV